MSARVLSWSVTHYDWLTITGTSRDSRNLLEHWNWWTGPLKVWTSTPLSKFETSWKIYWADLLYIEQKAFGLSCRKDRRTSLFTGSHWEMLKFIFATIISWALWNYIRFWRPEKVYILRSVRCSHYIRHHRTTVYSHMYLIIIINFYVWLCCMF